MSLVPRQSLLRLACACVHCASQTLSVLTASTQGNAARAAVADLVLGAESGASSRFKNAVERTFKAFAHLESGA